MRRFLLALCALLLGACQSSASTTAITMDWSYMVGSNADEIWHTKANFYRQGQAAHGSSNGSAGFVGPKALKAKDYRWRVGKGRGLYNQPVPDLVEIEWVSFHDKKRYAIRLDLPADLAEQMRQVYRVKVGNEWRETRRDHIGLGLATGGYVEVFLMDSSPYLSPDILLARGLAHEVTDEEYDPSGLRDPLSSQFKNRWARFEAEFADAYQQYPIPSGMAWAPIMDAYRAAQPKTDQYPVK
ncbi:DUF2931 family protein [Vibrio metschnikovii]|uniref:DUF2931 family protein n=1 Tax=Vibrio metschnikovii TaxID=28172 RepID=UPI0016445D93|nr:DUF2931 family protein [Vibrio metschnikovii]MBC3618525.1 DUF2931 family protein [Vibrio metschnikovii]MBC5814556.1 DUF2931 family protein [Vibrio metschnikovii]